MSRKISIIFMFLFIVTDTLTISFLKADDLSISHNLLSNPEIPNYTLIGQRDISEHKRVFWFKHTKTHADVVFTQDLLASHQLLSISLRTLPFDNSGVFHIIEHAVLDSSRKYDVPNLFTKLDSSNVTTYMNAFTLDDRTNYVVSSFNTQSFINLSNIFMDLIFDSNIGEHPEIFYREGIRREVRYNKFLSYNGIVFNEVKNNLDFAHVLFRQYKQVLLKGTGYAYEAGGDVLFIPNLTYDQVVETYRKYYHPSNSLVYFYGNSEIDIKERLEYLDINYFSRFEYDPRFEEERNNVISKFIPNRSKVYKSEYNANKSYTVEENSSIVLGFRIDRNDLESVKALELIFDLAFTNDSRYKQQLLDTGLLGHIDASVSIFGKYSLGIIEVSDVDPRNLRLVEQKILEVLNSIFRSDLSYDKKILRALIDRQYFLDKQEKINTPINLTDYENVDQGWINTSNPLAYVDPNEILDRFKNSLNASNSEFNESIFYRVLNRDCLGNRNYYVGVISPKSSLLEERNEKLYEMVLKEERKLTRSKIEDIIKINDSMREYNEKGLEVDISTIVPSVSLRDIATNNYSNRVYTPVSEEEDIDGMKFLKFDSKIPDIDHIEMFWGLSHLRVGELSYLSLLSDLLSNISTNYEDVSDLNDNINFLGNIQTGFRWLPILGNKIVPTLVIDVDYLTENQDRLFSMLKEILFNTSFEEKEKIKFYIRQLYLLNKNVSLNKNNLSGNNLSSSVSYQERLKSLTSGTMYIAFLEELVQNMNNDRYYELMISILRSVYEKVFLNGSCIVGIRSSSERFNDIESDVLRYFYKRYNPSLFKPVSYNIQSNDYRRPDAKDIIKISDEEKGFLLFVSTVDLDLANSGRSDVLSQLLNKYYLFPKIRGNGGAYNLNLKISDNGLFSFSSSEDPNAFNTLKIVQNIPKFLQEIQHMHRRNIVSIENSIKIGALSEFDFPESIAEVASRSFNRFFTKSIDENIMKRRNDIIKFSLGRSFTKKCVAMFTRTISQGHYSGSTSGYSEENEKLFR